MATQKALDALKKTKVALEGINSKLQPVLQKLNTDGFDKKKAEAKATVALSVGMMRFMGARLRGLDQGRKADDPLRKELNNMRAVLAEIKKKYAEKKSAQPIKEKPASRNSGNQESSKKESTKDSKVKVAEKEKESPAVEDRSKKRGTPQSDKSKKKRRKH